MDQQEKIKLILVYGKVASDACGKQQGMIDGRFTCGYREYAHHPGGLIIYPRPQKVSLPWEMSMPRGKGVAEFCRQHPDAVVWSVKKDKSKDRILAGIPNFKIYYSCCSGNSINKGYNVSLVDTERRMKGNSKLHLKGKDPEFWKPVAESKDYDYLLMGKRADKNEIYFIKKLTDEVKEERSILWLGGIKHKDKVSPTHHRVKITKMLGPDSLPAHISRCKVGILFSQHPLEGFPQTFLEMTMCGVPVVYGGPHNDFYFFPENSVRPEKKNLISAAEKLLANHDSSKSEACRERAEKSYSMQQAFDRLLSFKK